MNNEDILEKQLNKESKQSSELETQILENQATEILEDQKTEILEDQRTVFIERRKEEPMKMDDYQSTRIVGEGDIVNGYKIKRLISETSGEAYIHLCEKDGVDYVFKHYKIGRRPDIKLLKSIQELNSPYLVTPIEIDFHNSRDYEIQKYYKHDTLLRYIGKVDIDFIKNVIVRDVNEALKAFHSLGGAHNDVKPSNLFYTNDKKNIVLGDFGISQDLKGQTIITKLDGPAVTYFYAAPEAEFRSSKKSDYYSLGITLLHLLYEDLFEGVSDTNVFKERIKSGNFIPDDIDEDLGDLISGLTEFSIADRFGSKEVEKWLINNKAFKGQRKNRVAVVDGIEFKDPYTFRIANSDKSRPYYNMDDLGREMLLNIEEGLKHYDNAQFLTKIGEVDADLQIQLQQIYRKYQGNERTGLYQIIYKASPNLPIILNENVYNSFDSLLDDMKENPSDIDKYSDILNEDIVDAVFSKLEEEKRLELIKIIKEERRNDVINSILLAFNDEEIFHGNNSYSSLEEYSEVFFDNFRPIKIELLNNKIFMRRLNRTENIDLTNIIDERNIFIKNFLLYYEINQKLPFKFNNEKIGNMDELINVIIKSVKEGIDTTELEQFINSKNFLFVNSFTKKFSKQYIDKMRNSTNSLYYIYYMESKDNKYLEFDNIEELKRHVEFSGDIINLSTKIYNDDKFKTWIEIYFK